MAAALAAPLANAGTALFTPALNKAATTEAQPARSVAQPITLNKGALDALPAGAALDVTLPDASTHAFVLDQVRDHGHGIRSYVAYHRDSDPRRKWRAVITSGPDGSFGFVQTPKGEFDLVPGQGHDWLVDMKAESAHHAPVDLAGDARTPPSVARTSRGPVSRLAAAEYAQPVEGMTAPVSTKAVAAPAAVYIDVLFIYTRGFAAQLPGSQLQTKLAQLLSTANTAYADSGVGIVLRMAGATMVDYPDAVDLDNSKALSDITYASNAAFTGIASLRDQLGADLVTLLRASGDGYSGSGISWQPPHAITADDAGLMFSVVSGCSLACDWLWAHEIGHNMGNAHDRATLAWESAMTKQPEARGSFDYSHGFYTCNGAIDNSALTCPAFGGGCTVSEPQCAVSGSRNFADIMAYFHGSTRALVFSNPDIQCTGSDLACGLPDGYLDGTRPASANAALSMNNNRLALSAMRSAGPARAAAVGLPAVVTPAGARVDFNRDRVADLAWNGPNGAKGLWLLSAGAPASAAQLSAPAGATLRALADFDGDGASDALWRGADGSYWISLLDGTTVRSCVKVFDPMDGWEVVAVGDFNGDGRADLLWNAADGRFGTWLMNGTASQGIGSVTVPRDATVAIVGDFDGDGAADLLWKLSDGSVAATMMSGGNTGPLVTLMGAGTGFVPAMAGDLDGDGKIDVLLVHSDGRVVGWKMNGGTIAQSASLLGAGTGWTLAGVADLDGDGHGDLLWRYAADGTLGAWIMDGLAARAYGGIPGTSGAGWGIAATGDFDGDGRADLLLQGTGGGYAIWTMAGLAPKATRTVLQAGSGWTLAP